MRDLLTLYKLLWDQIKHYNVFSYGLCYECSSMLYSGLITKEEMVSIKFYITDKMPVLCVIGIISAYGWHNDKKGDFERKEFVQRRIKELENKE